MGNTVSVSEPNKVKWSTTFNEADKALDSSSIQVVGFLNRGKIDIYRV